jgi:hypothetical protein
VFIVVGLVLVALFVLLELRTRHPLLPMRIVLDRNRGGAYLTSTLVGAGLVGAFFFLSLYFQQVLGYEPVVAGLASLPTTLGILVSAGAASALTPRTGPKPLMVLGGLLAAAGLFTLSFVGLDTGFWELPFPGQLLLGLGLGFTFVPLSNLASWASARATPARRARCSTRPSRWAPRSAPRSSRRCRSARSAPTARTRWPQGPTRGTPRSACRVRWRATRRRSPGPPPCWWPARSWPAC